MATTPPPVVVLDDAGKSKHVRFKGVVGGDSLEVTDADLRDANSGDRRFFASLQSQRFMAVDAVGLGNLDRRYCVRFDVPAITDLPVPPLKARATPRGRRRRAGAGSGQFGTDVPSEKFSTAGLVVGLDTHAVFVGVWSAFVGTWSSARGYPVRLVWVCSPGRTAPLPRRSPPARGSELARARPPVVIPVALSGS